jgi:hypothetical protein
MGADHEIDTGRVVAKATQRRGDPWLAFLGIAAMLDARIREHAHIAIVGLELHQQPGAQADLEHVNLDHGNDCPLISFESGETPCRASLRVVSALA